MSFMKPRIALDYIFVRYPDQKDRNKESKS